MVVRGAVLLALLLGRGLGACGSSGAKHDAAGGSTATTGGAGPGGATGGTGAPHCDALGEYAGADYIDSGRSSEQSCEGTQVYCYEPTAPALETCDDTGAAGADAGAPAPAKGACPNVRSLCHTNGGCCESPFTLIAGPSDAIDESTACCYLAEPGWSGR